ncbi:hypothetical protein ACFWY5_41480 [Nonomuraea sp. NPDC059007]|uniref:hypothetical protein n=1 Tax=Nonomuraea sp. NPDC059007 TaxID=3346692 RepID=UPI0036BA638B
MSGWIWALWGLGGGLAVEVLDFVKAVRRVKGWPWASPDEPGAGPYLLSVLGRAAAAAVVAGAAGASVTGMTPLIALALGAAAPLILEKLSQQVPMQADVAGALPAGPPAASLQPGGSPGTTADPAQEPSPGAEQGGEHDAAR